MNNWPRLKMTEIAPIIRREVMISTEKDYPELGIRSFGKGTFHKPALKGSDAGSKRLFEIHAGDLIFSNVFAWEGAIAVATKDDHGRFGSHRFISCQVDQGKARAEYIKYYLTCSQEGIAQIQAASPGGAGRNRTLGLGKLGEITISLPPLQEQYSILDKIERLQNKTRQLNEHLAAIEADAETLLSLRLRAITQDAPVHRMADIAPAIRRSVEIDVQTKYREVGARSFGKGFFEKPPFDGAEATWQKPVWIRNGDLVLSNIKAWEGAIAVAEPTHDGCMASHRYITCIPKEGTVIAGYLSKYLLSPAGLEKIGNASPGTADRNRTLSLTNLGKMEIPVPAMSDQIAFDQLRQKIAAIKNQNNTLRQANDALIPATLERIFLR